MSVFRRMSIPCPACKAVVDFEAVQSVNADRAPELRFEILDGAFQRKVCDKCKKEFRLDPEMTYVDLGRKQWIAAYPIAKMAQWKKLESEAKGLFDRSFGAKAPPPARALAQGIRPRVTFGWAALREKIWIAQHSIDDTALELTKVALIRNMKELPLSKETELRLVDMQRDEFVMAWVHISDETLVSRFFTNRSYYDDIFAHPEGWEAATAELKRGPWVDMARLLMVDAD